MHYIFIGSSTEGLDVAEALQANLSRIAECQLWTQGHFGLSYGTLENLEKKLPEFDFSIFIITPDDLTIYRGSEKFSPRDNVIFELGLSIGLIGRNRTFFVVDKDAQPRLPSDLAGITSATFERPKKGKLRDALGSCCYEIQEAIKEVLTNNEKRLDKFSETSKLNRLLTQLKEDLENRKWQEADLKTTLIMLRACDRLETRTLTLGDLKNFSCETLYLLDQLWLEHSEEKLGFSIQYKIWRNLYGEHSPNENTWCEFGDRIGWRNCEKWINPYQNLDDLIPGMLPWGWGNHVIGIPMAQTWWIFLRLIQCDT